MPILEKYLKTDYFTKTRAKTLIYVGEIKIRVNSIKMEVKVIHDRKPGTIQLFLDILEGWIQATFLVVK